jgi:signal peptidase I
MITVVATGLAVGVALLTLAGVRRRYVLVAVTGSSMLPTLAAGDRVMVRRVRPHRVRPGNVVVARTPGTGGDAPARQRVAGETWLVKRVTAVGSPPGTVVLHGDNAARSRDSRHWGPVPADRVLGVVVTVFHRR